jgi:hypothetical protein
MKAASQSFQPRHYVLNEPLRGQGVLPGVLNHSILQPARNATFPS